MLLPESAAKPIALGAALLLGVVLFLSGFTWVLLLIAPPAVAALLRAPARLGLAVVAVLVAGHALLGLRVEHGVGWVAWLVAIVLCSDIGGYFAGRAIGGPKLWPAVSPAKTWSGSAAGWLLAMVIGLIWAGSIGAVLLSLATCVACQLGDLGESALKRRSGVKDGSSLLPGHGGLVDRFDGMTGAAIFVQVVLWLGAFPPAMS